LPGTAAGSTAFELIGAKPGAFDAFLAEREAALDSGGLAWDPVEHLELVRLAGPESYMT
jgi:hypothetical protein